MPRTKSLPNGMDLIVDDEGLPQLLHLEMRSYTEPSDSSMVECMFALPGRTITGEDVRNDLLALIDDLVGSLPETKAKALRAEAGENPAPEDWARAFGSELPGGIAEALAELDGLEATAIEPVPVAVSDVGDGLVLIYRMGMN